MTEAVKLTQTKAKASASLLPNNLVYNGSLYAYVSRNEVYLVDHKTNLFELEKAERVLKSSYADKDNVSTIALCQTADGKILVLATASGTLAAFEENGEKLLASHKLQKSQVALSVKDAYLRGIAHDGKSHLFFGSGSGDVLLFKLSAGKLNLLKKAPTSFSRAIWAVAYDASLSLLASGDEAGNIACFTIKPGSEDIERSWEAKGSGMPITSVAIGHDLLVTADTTGKIRAYSLEKKSLVLEIAAHSRNINAIAIHPTKPMLACASEDCFLSVWTLPTAAQPAVRSLIMYSPAPALLTGVVFSGKNAEQIVSTIYDSKSLFCIPTPDL